MAIVDTKVSVNRIPLLKGRRDFVKKYPPSFQDSGKRGVIEFYRDRNALVTARITSPNQIPIAGELAEEHWLKDFILRESPIISKSDVDKILETIENTIQISYFDNGAIQASPNPHSTYSFGTWRRDDAIMIHSFITAASVLEGNDRNEILDKARKELIHWARFDNLPESRGRYTSFFFLNPDPGENRKLAKERFKKDINGLPRALASITNDGGLGEYYDWGHNQLDAIGSMLYMYFYSANNGVIDLKELDEILNVQNPENREDSILSVGLHLLHEIEYWDQNDLGAWEKEMGNKRASSVGLCLSAFQEAKKYFESKGWNPNQTFKVNAGVDIKRIIEEGIKNGEATISERIPSDGRPAVETDAIQKDSALAFLLLFNPNLNKKQEEAILNTVYELMGDYGFKRMPDNVDAFMGEDHTDNPHGGIWSDLNKPNHSAAQWTLFDPILAGYYYKRYTDSEGLDENSFLLADKHLKRTLSQITKHDYNVEQFYETIRDGRKVTEKGNVFIPAGTLPEARFKKNNSSGSSEWLPNRNSPLQMSHAVLSNMMVELAKAIELKQLKRIT